MYSSTARSRVLCVDDNMDGADSMADLLRVVGFDSVSCYCGTEASKLAVGFRPHVCLLDLNMPGMDGYELARQLRRLLGCVLLVAVSAATGEEHERRFATAGFDARLQKPVELAELLDVLASSPA